MAKYITLLFVVLVMLLALYISVQYNDFECWKTMDPSLTDEQIRDELTLPEDRGQWLK